MAQAHLAILVGPSIGTAKSKLIVGIDGLEARVWGSDGGSTVPHNCTDQSNNEDANESQEDYDDDDDSEEEPAESEDEDEGQDEDDEEEEDDSRLPSPLPPYLSHAEEQKFLQNADRLLSRTLAAADADGNGITSEMCTCATTFTHINQLTERSSAYTNTHSHTRS